jgi:hypothetical protein
MGPLFKLVILSILIERFLAVFFDLTGMKELLQTEVQSSPSVTGSSRKLSGKGLIAAGVGILVCLGTGFDVVNPIIEGPPVMDGITRLDGTLAQIITGIIIAGGSQGSVKLFQDVLGFSKENRDILKQTQTHQQEAAQIRADADKKAAEIERLRQVVAMNQLVGGSAAASGRSVLDGETEALLRAAVPDAEERAILLQKLDHIERRGDV